MREQQQKVKSAALFRKNSSWSAAVILQELVHNIWCIKTQCLVLTLGTESGLDPDDLRSGGFIM